MPNHVVNEVIFRGITPEQRDDIMTNVLNAGGKIDFGILVPIPLNCWMGNVSEHHEKAFQNTALDWCRENWGTKWNAYGQVKTDRTDDGLHLIFETAWRPPYGWLCALFNRFKLPFDHNWMSEGDSVGRCGKFDWAGMEDQTFRREPWSETDADPDMHRYLHKLQWGVEAFDEDASDD
jgi:hypothetical protein